ncbi:MAG: hypothetical protein K2X87_33310 [Gemmataceae bacterium]|nr:hypothetical protein [Gemmataceae bacterium]
MDELIKSVAARAGISEEQAKKAVQSVVEFLKAKFPAIGGQLEGLIQGGGGGLGDIAGKIGGMLGGGKG